MTGPGGAQPRTSPVARFLGASAAGRGPFAMLGLPFADAPDHAVMAALQRRLLMVDTHPEAMTPQADEVRLALHAAAAQLLDAKVKRVLAEKWGVRTGWHAGGPAEADAGAGPGGGERELAGLARLELERDAVLTLAMHGGWNARALRRLTMVAHQRGWPSSAVAEVLRGMARRPGRSAPERRQPERREPAGERGPDVVSEALSAKVEDRVSVRALMETIAPDIESERMLRKVLVIGGVSVLSLAAAIASVIILTSVVTPRPPAPPGPVAVTPPAPNGPGPSPELFPAPGPVTRPKPEPARASGGAASKDVSAVARDLAAAVEGIDADPDAALVQFKEAVALCSRGWGSLADDQHRAAQDAVIEFIYRASSRPAILQQAVAAIREPAGAIHASGGLPSPDDIWRAAWAVGLLTRLESERDLPAAARLDVQAELQRSAPGRRADAEAGFTEGAWAALNQLPRRLIPPARAAAEAPSEQGDADTTGGDGPAGPRLDAWRAWIDAVGANSKADPRRGMRAMLVALETVMTEGPEPGPGNDVEGVIGLLTERLTWRQDDESRAWLVRWLGAPGVSSADLNAVTQALASRASAPGFDPTMVLASAAGEGQRQELRDRLARAWTLSDAGNRADAVAEWAAICRERLGAAESTAGLSGHLAGTVVFSRLNAAAQQIWLGQSEAARETVERLNEGIDLGQDAPPAREGRLGDGGDDAGWAVKYIQVDRNIPERMSLLTARASGGGTLGQVEGALIASEAVRGAPESVRRSARDLVRRFGSDPSMINGLLEEVPSMPITGDNAQLIRSIASVTLPALSDPGWREAVRRALVERLVEVLAAQGEFGVIDRMTELLAESYEARARESDAPQPATSAAPAAPAKAKGIAPADESVRVLRLRWQSSSSAAIPSGREPFSPDQIARRYAARAALAEGKVQHFAADQAALCEYIAYVVTTEQPARAEETAQVLARLAEARRAARTILEQTHAVERAMTELWLIRLEGGAA